MPASCAAHGTVARFRRHLFVLLVVQLLGFGRFDIMTLLIVSVEQSLGFEGDRTS